MWHLQSTTPALCFITESYFACMASCMWYESMMKCTDVSLFLHSDKPAQLEIKSAPMPSDCLLWRGWKRREWQREEREREGTENWILIRLDWRTEVVISNKGRGLNASSMLTHTRAHSLVGAHLLTLHSICTFYSWSAEDKHCSLI